MAENEVSLFKTIKDVLNDAKSSENFGTGLAGEAVIIASYQKMSIEHLEKMRYIINRIIKSKKEKLAVIKSNDGHKDD